MESLPSYKDLKNRFPLYPAGLKFIEESRQTVRNILNGLDRRLLLILGPCSIHDLKSANDFALRLSQLSKEVASEFFLVMRVYCEKPRTAFGWKGFLSDPLLDGSHAIDQGIEWTRRLLLDLAAMQVPAAAEFLQPLTAFYYDDLITWGSIGARTASSQIHRNLASGLSMPIGFKNGVAGNVSAAVNGVLAATHSHTYMHICENGKPAISRTKGNSDAHIVLRGGEEGPNYDSSSVSDALFKLEKAKLPPRLLIDCAHHNSEKKHDRQPAVFHSVMDQITAGNPFIRGMMIESHLHGGNQELQSNPALLRYGISITDPCLDWESTAHLIRRGAGQYQHFLSSLNVQEKHLSALSNLS